MPYKVHNPSHVETILVKPTDWFPHAHTHKQTLTERWQKLVTPSQLPVAMGLLAAAAAVVVVAPEAEAAVVVATTT